MLCDKCKKNEATIHVKKVLDGKIESLHLCAECAKEKEDQGVLGAFGFNLAEVLFNIGELAKKDMQSQEQQGNERTGENAVSCPVCHWDMQKLQESNGRLGCPACYQAFAGIISDALNRIQKGKVHLGKHPDQSDPLLNIAALRIEIERIRRELADFVRREEYEQAAVCRDKLNGLNDRLRQIENPEAENEK